MNMDSLTSVSHLNDIELEQLRRAAHQKYLAFFNKSLFALRLDRKADFLEQAAKAHHVYKLLSLAQQKRQLEPGARLIDLIGSTLEILTTVDSKDAREVTFAKAIYPALLTLFDITNHKAPHNRQLAAIIIEKIDKKQYPAEGYLDSKLTALARLLTAQVKILQNQRKKFCLWIEPQAKLLQPLLELISIYDLKNRAQLQLPSVKMPTQAPHN